MSESRDPGANPALPARDEPAHGVDRGDRLHEFRGTDVSVTWSRRRCIHVGACVMSLPRVFEPGRRPWVDATQTSADAISPVVARCPTGALHCERSDGVAETAPATNTALLTRHGPIYLHGDIEVLDESGAPRLADTRVALCRCGGSANKPLCDGTHFSIGFRDGGTIGAGNDFEGAGVRDAKLRVRPERDGPVLLDGPFTLVSADRRRVVPRSGARLCRCGRSESKPFCDGSHKHAGFVSG